ncbi:AbrB/MazE/SpoVT family DNA-binding domain-containing protein [Leucobacter tenebrionis]|uniref:AbrB/MazE/SpoVT family DNA-binding domain-containing protein n=1 Tax=Leucobacter tenebrionis TaxID=2873270 RepID=UPI001CA61ADA|nr:AbrB/MazE/SpoVT family DNA-binding domain-containing protein [Leucobacter tenebrionis]QZY50814.1 AbrB/MazE/SpoVT family DNA-binding domain-containing protein [Leucobacter tenebrionis]
MITTIDKAGRVVIPKQLREAMGLQPGAKLDITYAEGRIEIDYAPVEARVRMLDDGFPVIETSDPELYAGITDQDLREAREEIYAEREARWV